MGDAVGGGPSALQQAPQQPHPQEVVPPEWNEECDRFSFDDSDRFEEDSLCSWSSEPESLCNNWRGWKRPINNGNFGNGSNKKFIEGIFKCLRLPRARTMSACFFIMIRYAL